MIVKALVMIYSGCSELQVCSASLTVNSQGPERGGPYLFYIVNVALLEGEEPYKLDALGNHVEWLVEGLSHYSCLVSSNLKLERRNEEVGSESASHTHTTVTIF